VGVAGLLLAAALPPLYCLPVLPELTAPAEDTVVSQPAGVEPAPIGMMKSPAVLAARSMATPAASAPENVAVSHQDSSASSASTFDLTLSKPESHSKPRTTDWRLLAVIGYCAVAGALLFRLAIGMLLARRAYNRSSMAPEWVQSLVRDCADEFG